jgi:type II secretory pathway pseudopilin PulG
MLIARQHGYSLLEVLLALALATTSLLAVQNLLQGYWQRTQWWQLLAQVNARQVEVAESLRQLHDQRCLAGLIHGDKHQWRLQLDLGKGCQVYDVRFDASKGQLQRRRSGGRYSSFISDVRLQEVRYAVAASDACTPQVWLVEVSADEARRVVLMQLSMLLAIKGSGHVTALPQGWQIEKQQAAQVMWVPMTIILSLGCDHGGN